MSKNILVTGGAGFIGSNLVRNLLNAGNTVTVLDNFQTGVEANIKGLNVKLINGSSSKILEYDVGNIDVIYHLGMPSTMMLYRNDSVSNVQECIVGSHKILELCRERGCKLIFASSSSVYNGLDLPHNEEREILVKDFYTEARIAVERLAKLYSNLYGVNSIGFRFFAVYGPREEHKKGYANLVSQCIWSHWHGTPFTVFGDGKQTRDFTHVDDIVRILTDAMNKNFDNTEIFNIGTGANYSLNEIIEIISSELGKAPNIVYAPNPVKNYVQTLLADITKLKKEFTPPQIDLREGVRRLVEYYKNESTPPNIGDMTDYWISKVKTK